MSSVCQCGCQHLELEVQTAQTNFFVSKVTYAPPNNPNFNFFVGSNRELENAFLLVPLQDLLKVLSNSVRITDSMDYGHLLEAQLPCTLASYCGKNKRKRMASTKEFTSRSTVHMAARKFLDQNEFLAPGPTNKSLMRWSQTKSFGRIDSAEVNSSTQTKHS